MSGPISPPPIGWTWMAECHQPHCIQGDGGRKIPIKRTRTMVVLAAPALLHHLAQSIQYSDTHSLSFVACFSEARCRVLYHCVTSHTCPVSACAVPKRYFLTCRLLKFLRILYTFETDTEKKIFVKKKYGFDSRAFPHDNLVKFFLTEI